MIRAPTERAVLRLQLQGHIAVLILEQGATMGRFEAAESPA
jgi:hypothetical protein